MSLLSYNQLIQLVQRGVITAPESAVNASSIDLTLADLLLTERPLRAGEIPRPIDLMGKENLPMMAYSMQGYGDPEGAYYDLLPGEFILASSVELFHLPNDISAEYMQKSSLARNGLEHLAAGWCDAGWNGSTLTLELFNTSRYRPLRLRPGMKIGQMKFFQHAEVPAHASYATKGQYNSDKGVTPTKSLK